LQLFGQLLEFNFPNGPLRRKYDGVKYAKKRLEDVLYEMSLSSNLSNNAEGGGDGGGESGAAAAAGGGKGGEEGTAAARASLLPVDELDAIREKMGAYDEKREQVIKRSRDIQKLSKQAIFSLHRGALEDAHAKLRLAAQKAFAIQEEFLNSESRLRAGTYANAMEEWAEAQLFAVWLASGSSCTIATKAAMEGAASEMLGGGGEGGSEGGAGVLTMTTDEYFGGLIDFTGEVGRWAVVKATQRDLEGLNRALAADATVAEAVLSLGDAAPGRLVKKGNALRTNMRKLEHLRYEMMLVKGTGRKTMAVAAPGREPSESKDDGGEASRL
jgi:predicted translin family RNA/ssDNA-binding protein